MLQHVTILKALLSMGEKVAIAITQVTHSLLWEEATHSNLTQAQRELIFALVSKENDCTFCQYAHAAIAACHLDLEFSTIMEALSHPQESSIFDERTKNVLSFVDKMKNSGNQDAVIKASSLPKEIRNHAHNIILWADYENALVNVHQQGKPLTDAKFYTNFARKLTSVGGYKPMMDEVLSSTQAEQT